MAIEVALDECGVRIVYPNEVVNISGLCEIHVHILRCENHNCPFPFIQQQTLVSSMHHSLPIEKSWM
jgi:hypothetical protein